MHHDGGYSCARKFNIRLYIPFQKGSIKSIEHLRISAVNWSITGLLLLYWDNIAFLISSSDIFESNNSSLFAVSSFLCTFSLKFRLLWSYTFLEWLLKSSAFKLSDLFSFFFFFNIFQNFRGFDFANFLNLCPSVLLYSNLAFFLVLFYFVRALTNAILFASVLLRLKIFFFNLNSFLTHWHSSLNHALLVNLFMKLAFLLTLPKTAVAADVNICEKSCRFST